MAYDWRFCSECGETYEKEVPDWVMDGKHHCASRTAGYCPSCEAAIDRESERLHALRSRSAKARDAVKKACLEHGCSSTKAEDYGSIVEWAIELELI